ncbi:MAG: hypothetical protein IPM96_21540 [Ignavibacteria bacterium]|nr:hypothetical protein [Ignavibacteria bacterium]
MDFILDKELISEFPFLKRTEENVFASNPTGIFNIYSMDMDLRNVDATH